MAHGLWPMVKALHSCTCTQAAGPARIPPAGHGQAGPAAAPSNPTAPWADRPQRFRQTYLAPGGSGLRGNGRDAFMTPWYMVTGTWCMVHGAPDQRQQERSSIQGPQNRTSSYHQQRAGRPARMAQCVLMLLLSGDAKGCRVGKAHIHRAPIHLLPKVGDPRGVLTDDTAERQVHYTGAQALAAKGGT